MIATDLTIGAMRWLVDGPVKGPGGHDALSDS